MPDIENYEVYNDRMRQSMWDKAFFMDKIPGSELIIDYGCADGSLISFLHGLFPSMRFIGFDIDEGMIRTARVHAMENVWFFSDFSEMLEQIRTLNVPGERIAINFSSVFHEVFHYGFDLTALGSFIRAVAPRYLVVRDMMFQSINPEAQVSSDVENKVRSVLPAWQIRDFEACWGPIRVRRNLVHLLLKYKYIENWERECAENYFSVTEEKLFQTLDPEGKYETILCHRYILPWIRYDIQEKFSLDMGLEFTTHAAIILSARGKNCCDSLSENL